MRTPTSCSALPQHGRFIVSILFSILLFCQPNINTNTFSSQELCQTLHDLPCYTISHVTRSRNILCLMHALARNFQMLELHINKYIKHKHSVQGGGHKCVAYILFNKFHWFKPNKPKKSKRSYVIYHILDINKIIIKLKRKRNVLIL